jgi:hypothetical protein
MYFLNSYLQLYLQEVSVLLLARNYNRSWDGLISHAKYCTSCRNEALYQIELWDRTGLRAYVEEKLNKPVLLSLLKEVE